MVKRVGILLLMLLFLCGCSEWRKKQYEGYTPFHEAAKAGNIEQLAHDLDRGADINQRSRSAQCTALGCAVRWKQYAAAKFLLEKGANPAISFRIASIRYTPFQMAARIGDERMVRLILPYLESVDEGMDGIYPTGNRSAFTWACLLDDLSLAKLLLEKGANINARNYNQEGTPLIIAVRKLRIDAVRFLLENGADPEVTDHLRDLSALEWAEAMREGIFVRIPTPPGRTASAQEREEALRVHAQIVDLLKKSGSVSKQSPKSEG